MAHNQLDPTPGTLLWGRSIVRHLHNDIDGHFLKGISVNCWKIINSDILVDNGVRVCLDKGL